MGRDFLNFWMYGRAATGSDPGAWYDASAYQHALATLLGNSYPGQNWSYPPSVMLLAAPFGQLAYVPALLCWTGIGLTVLAAVLRALNSLTVAVLVFPAAIFCLISGQSSLLTTAVLMGIFAMLDRRPIVAGILIGCLTLKPQLGLLFPVLLLASGRWRAFGAASAASVLIAGLAAVAFGAEAWIAFFQKALPVQNVVLSDPDGIATPFYATVFMNLRGAGLPYWVAMAIHAVVAVGAAGIVWWAFRMRRDVDPQILAALFVSCSIAATPYLLSYDTLALTVLALNLVRSGALDVRGRLLAKLVFWLPLIQMAFGILHVPGPGLIAPAFGLYLAARLRSRPDLVAQKRQRARLAPMSAER